MYYIKAEHSFDSAHFLSGYDGKCKNIHGHRWRVVITVKSEKLIENGAQRGMLEDFGVLKDDVKAEADYFDHALIAEKNSLKESTATALKAEDFKLIEVSFRPTAENFAKYFFDRFKERGYDVKSAEVYETPNNCAIYEE